jgi:16S rRNA (guanine527-N7)-methyltransferase
MVTLVEPLLRRTIFLAETIERLEMTNVAVCRARAEDLHGELEFSVVTARAVAPLSRLLEWSMPLVRSDGQLLAIKGASASRELRSASTQLRRSGARSAEVLVLGTSLINPPTTVIRVTASNRSRLG